MCLYSILRSAFDDRVMPIEVLVIDHGSDVVPSPGDDERIRVIVDNRPMPSGELKTRIGITRTYENAFCKSRLLNLGIQHARGDVITILDADAIVGKHWLYGPNALLWPNVHRVCYRVRYAEMDLEGVVGNPDAMEELIQSLFSRYDSLPLAWEAYGHPWKNCKQDQTQQPWGNSQFTMRGEDIADLRFDEGYIGKGHEDIDFNRQVFAKFGESFRGVICTHPDSAMVHLRHDYDDDRWGNAAFKIANADRYTGKHYDR